MAESRVRRRGRAEAGQAREEVNASAPACRTHAPALCAMKRTPPSLGAAFRAAALSGKRGLPLQAQNADKRKPRVSSSA